MTIAWFSPSGHRDGVARVSHDHLAGVVAALGRTHAITHVDRETAHQFVWRHDRQPFDLCVYELADTPDHQFIWAYLLRYPGVVVLRSPTLSDHRARQLVRSQRAAQWADERLFSEQPMRRIPLLAARLTIVFDRALAATLRAEHPSLHIEFLPPGVPPGESTPHHSAVAAQAPIRFGTPSTDHLAMIERAMARAQAAGAHAELAVLDTRATGLHDADVVLALDWPAPAEWPSAALAAMTLATPSVVFETVATAAWPALDPQTWQPRNPRDAQPITVSLSLRDGEHSLMLAIQRLSADPALRTAVGEAGHEWWAAHATLEPAVDAWTRVLATAQTIPAPPRPPDWPAHLTMNGTETMRRVLDECAASVDF